MSSELPSLPHVFAARKVIAGQIRRTPLVESPSLSDAVNDRVHLKLENQQTTGSFKLRGATNAVRSLSKDDRARGIVGVSTGNHGRGLAFAAKQAGVRCVVCMSSLVPKNKVDGIRALGAEVRIVGSSQDEAEEEVTRLVKGEGMIQLPPFDNPRVIAGQGTIGLEILEDLPDTETLVVPMSGGGLISGIACAAKGVNPKIRIVGVTMEKGAAMYESRKAGHPVEVEELPSLADSLGGGIGLDNHYTFRMVSELVDDSLLVSEAQIAEGIRHAYWEEKQIIEGGGAVGIAALKAGLVERPGRTAVVLSGSNIDMPLHHRIIGGDNPNLAEEKRRDG